MKNEIHILPKSISDKIAAGEVAENPSNIIKELVENSFDAKATQIIIELKNSGIDFIRITDNGKGILPDDLIHSIERHATSKINSIEDVYNIQTFGFRGEAIAAIASVCKFSIQSMRTGFESKILTTNGGENTKISTGKPIVGTTVIVKDIFYNVPARRKFLKTSRSYTNDILKLVRVFSIINPSVEIQLINDGKQLYHAEKDATMLDRAKIAFKNDEIVYFENSDKGKKIFIAAGFPTIQRYRRDSIYIGVNGRVINDTKFMQGIIQAYHRLIPDGKFPVCAISLQLPYDRIDVNIHPSKMEIKFQKKDEIFSFIHSSILLALKSIDMKSGVAGEAVDSVADTLNMPKIAEISKRSPSSSGGGYKQETINSFTELPKSFSKPNSRVGANKIDIGRNFDVEERSFTSSEVAEESPEKFSAGELEILGQLAKCFILCENKSGDLILIDQHVAHERILFEKYDKEDKEVKTTIVLHEAILIELSETDMERFQEIQDSFIQYGFKLHLKDNKTISITQIPSDFIKSDTEKEIKQLFLDALNLKASKTEDYYRVLRACKKAIKSGDSLSMEDMQILVKSLMDTTNPRTCPHGRPIIIKIAKKDLWKKFGRT